MILEGEHQDVAYCVNPGRDLPGVRPTKQIQGEINGSHNGRISCVTQKLMVFFGGTKKKTEKFGVLGGSKFELFIIS